MLDGTEYFECECGAAEHTLRFVLDKEENELYTEIYLHQYRRLYKRIWIAIKYAFGYKCRYGHWDTWILQVDDASRLIKLLQKLEGK